MADDTDFITLYDELGLSAACSMADFKHAYRRRVAQLHPDHHESSSDLSRLQRINRLYAAALEFHRNHGRLPGAVASPGPGLRRESPEAPSSPDSERMEMSGTGSHWRYVLLMVLLGVVLYGLLSEQPTTTTGAEPKAAAAQESHRPAVNPLLVLGMDEEQVRRIQGEPFNSHQMRWEYGPSWILFECRVVVDWYSSPLHPLRVESAHPAESAKHSSRALRKC